jgi:homoserine O-acetyltransferase/O-succinyltransferase
VGRRTVLRTFTRRWGTLLTVAVLRWPFVADARNFGTVSETNSSAAERDASLDAKQADAWFENYKFRNGQVTVRLRIHYATLGTPHRDAHGDVDNAVLVLHWTGVDGRSLCSPEYMAALFASGKPLDARRYYLIFPDNVGHGRSTKPSDGLRARFPNYGYADIVELQHRLVTETLGIQHLRAILGMSMGGMNAWQWAEAYPDEMDGIMPVVSLPFRVSGRNLLWRRMVIDSVRSDPEWADGNYTKAPTSWLRGYELLRLMIEGVPHLQASIPDGRAADRFIDDARKQAESIDANDLLYSLSSSADYDPEPGLPAIKAKVFALNFGDDEFNPEELHVLERLMPLVKNGRFVVQPATTQSDGHLTMAHPELWADQVAYFMRELDHAEATMPIRHIEVQRFSVISKHPFDKVLAKLKAAVGHPDMRVLGEGIANARNYAEVEKLVHSMEGSSGLMEMAEFDLGQVLSKAAGAAAPKSFRFLIGNPLTMKQLVEHVPDAGSYAPVTILVDVRPDGVHLSYDMMASLIGPYGNADALRVAASLDAKVEALLRAAAASE